MKRHFILFLLSILTGCYINIYAQNLNLPAGVAGSGTPTIIKMGTYSNDFVYNDVGNTGRGSDGYRGTTLQDLFYEFTITEYMDIQIVNRGLPLSCGPAPTSGTYQSNLYLIKANPYELIKSQISANSAICSLTSKQLAPGTYYAIYETGLTNVIANITVNITGKKVQPLRIINIGKMSMEKVYQDTQNTSLLPNAYQGYSTNDICYRFTVDKPFEAIISHCGSSLIGTCMYLLDDKMNFIHSLKVNNNNCAKENEINCVLAPGTYRVISEGISSNGSIQTQIFGSRSYSYYTDIGNVSSNFTKTYEANTANGRNFYNGQFGKGNIYRINLTNRMKICVSHEGSALKNTSAYLLDQSFNLVKTITFKNENEVLISDELPAGEYFIISQGANEEGMIKTKITGAVPGQHFQASSHVYTKDFHYTHTQNTKSTTNAHLGRPVNDVFYRIDLRTAMDLVISHCGSEVENTYVYLLNSSYNTLYSRNGSTGAEGCSNSKQAYLRIENLAAGVYYVVSEGYSAEGNITTTIEGITRNRQSAKTPPANQNYIREFTPLAQTTNATALTLDKCMQTITYFDGLGRETQTIQVGITPKGDNLILGQEYDEFARPYKAWLPTPSSGAQIVPVEGLGTLAMSYHGDRQPYTINYYESIADPMDRVIESSGPGEAWRPRIENGYQTNTESGNFSVDYYYINSSGVLVQNGKYAKNELYVESVRDEDGKIRYTFMDKLGRVVLERQMNDSEQINTYYVYDKRGKPAYILPPMINGNISQDNLSKYAYIYKHDGKGRCISLKIPGAEEKILIYDKSDRLVFSQDGNQNYYDIVNKNGEYKFTGYKYDVFGRMIYQYEITPATSAGVNLTNYVKDKSFTETFSTQSQPTSLKDTGYSNVYVPFPTSTTQLIVVNYYDDYAFLDLLSSTVKSQLQYTTKTGYGVNYSNAQGRLTGKRVYDLNEKNKYTVHAYYYDVHGNVIQEHATNHLDGYEKNYYKRSFTGKTEVHHHEHSIAGQDAIKQTYLYNYDHANRLKKLSHRFGNQATVALAAISYNELGLVEDKYNHSDYNLTHHTYNIRNQLTETVGTMLSQKLTYLPYYNGNLASYEWQTADQGYWRKYSYTYDGLDRLKKAEYMEYGRSVSSANKGNYNVEINEYDKNGNIRQLTRYGLHTAHTLSSYSNEPVSFTSKVGVIDKLIMTYSGNRLLAVKDEAPYDPIFNGAMHFVDGANQATEYEYDRNGNMTKDLNRRISSVSYNVLNLPMSVDFSINKGYRTHYHYNGEGKKLRVRYLSANANEALSIPVVASIASVTSPEENDVIENLQDNVLSGQSLVATNDSSLVAPNNGIITYPNYPMRILDYCGNVLYKDGALDRILTPEGYIEKNSAGKFVYHYYVKDYLGNNRMVVDEDLVIKQVNHYYPFGALFGEQYDVSGQNFKFGGKELDRIHGLNWSDFEARMKDLITGRFISIDPHAERYYSISPYAYCFNNPVKFVDPDGRKVYFAKGVSNEFKRQFGEAVQYLNENKVGGMLADLHASDNVYYIADGGELANSNFNPSNQTITWGATTGLLTNEGIELSPTSILNHEIDHALQFDQNPSQLAKDVKTPVEGYKNKEEQRVIEGSEQRTAKAFGEIKEGEVTRRDHKGMLYSTTGPTTTEWKDELIVKPE